MKIWIKIISKISHPYLLYFTRNKRQRPLCMVGPGWVESTRFIVLNIHLVLKWLWKFTCIFSNFFSGYRAVEATYIWLLIRTELCSLCSLVIMIRTMEWRNKGDSTSRFILTRPDFSQIWILTPSEMAIFFWKMRTMLNRMKNLFSDF